MSLQVFSQIAGPISNVLLGLVFAVGYYIIIRLYREVVTEMREDRLSGGRPQVIVQADYKRLPEVEIAVRNVAGGAAKEIAFEFSSPIESSDGFVVTDLPYFQYGLDFLEPGGEITCYWDSLEELIPSLRKKGLEDGVLITTKYKSLAGEPYTSTWRMNPLLFEGYRSNTHKGMEDLVASVEKIQKDLKEIIDDREDEAQNP
ncbi:hypothetical protein BH24ACT21_BH24ACT21_01460 [soil metagenome]|jgi:hypothetical protein